MITEPEDLARCAAELSDLESYLSSVENYADLYIWGEYNVVIMPPRSISLKLVSLSEEWRTPSSLLPLPQSSSATNLLLM